MTISEDQDHFDMFADPEKFKGMNLNLGFIKATIQTTSKGVLRKFTGIIEGELYYIKTGTRNSFGEYSHIEPMIEVIISRIGTEMGFNCIPYDISAIPKGKNKFEYDTVVCVSKNFLNKDEQLVPMADAVEVEKVDHNQSTYLHTLSYFPHLKKDLDCMIIFDYIFNNSDRHWNNFGIILDSVGRVKLAPLYDHGYCLYGGEHDADLKLQYKRYLNYFEPSSSFRNKQSKNLKLVSNVSELGLNLTKEPEYYYKYFEEFDKYFSEERSSLMKTLFARRYSHVRNLQSNV